MHENEVEVNEEIVKALILEQLPAYKDLPVERVHSTGTVNAIFKLGDELCVRLPTLEWANESLHVEYKVLPIISKNVSLKIPEVIEKGKPSYSFPLEFFNRVYHNHTRKLHTYEYDYLRIGYPEISREKTQVVEQSLAFKNILCLDNGMKHPSIQNENLGQTRRWFFCLMGSALRCGGGNTRRRGSLSCSC